MLAARAAGQKTTSILALTRQGSAAYRDYEERNLCPGPMSWRQLERTRKSLLWRQARKFSLPCRRWKNCVIWIFRRGYFRALHGTFAQQSQRTGRYYRRCAFTDCGRSGGTAKLGPISATRRYFHRHGRIWRQRPRRPVISAFWHHGRRHRCRGAKTH